MRRAPTDFAEYHRRRWRARLLTLPYALAGGYLAYAVVRALTGRGGINPFGLIPFLLLLALAAPAWRRLGRASRRSFAARPVTQSLDPTPGEVFGIPELDLSLIHISEPTRLGMISYAVFCLKKKK